MVSSIMNLKTIIIGLLLIINIVGPASGAVAFWECSDRTISSPGGELLHAGIFSPEYGKEPDTNSPSRKETPNDCCSSCSDYDPAAGADTTPCKAMFNVTMLYLPTGEIVATDPSYPINKPPQN